MILLGGHPQPLKQEGIQRAAVTKPQDQRFFHAAAVVSFVLRDLVIPQKGSSQIRLRNLDFRDLPALRHGFHILDLIQFIPCGVQLQLQFFHLQTFPFQGNIRKGGIIGQQDIAFFHCISGLNQYLCDGLGAGQKHCLDLICGHRTIALLGVAPVFGHADIAERIYIHRLGSTVLVIIPASGTGCHQHCHYGQQDHRNPPLRFTLHPSALPSGMRQALQKADHPECSNTYRHNRRSPAHG